MNIIRGVKMQITDRRAVYRAVRARHEDLLATIRHVIQREGGALLLPRALRGASTRLGPALWRNNGVATVQMVEDALARAFVCAYQSAPCPVQNDRRE